jgi:hypothetical protein
MFGRNKVRKILDDYERRKIEELARGWKVSFDQALKRVIEKGLRYVELENAYGGGVKDRELWDKTYRLLKVESAYLHYRLLYREAVEEIRGLTMTLSSVISNLETCFNSLPSGGNNVAELRNKEIDRLKKYVRLYMERYLRPSSSNQPNEKGEVNDADLLNEIEELVKRYREVFKVGERSE